MTKRRSKKPKHYWAGFVDGKPHLSFLMTCDYEIRFVPAVFCTKKDALKFYQDVRKVHIEESHP